jgi:hypothetical protein
MTLRLAVAAAAFSLTIAPFAFAGPQGHPHVVVPHGQAGQHGKAGQPHGKAAAHGNADAAHTTDIASRIERNPQQKARLEAMLPAGMTLEQAASGFRNQGQFIAALQASKNLNIPFADLKAQMTGSNHLSLGQAVQKLKPGATPPSDKKPGAPDNDQDNGNDKD